MASFHWLHPLLAPILGRDARRRRHVLYVLFSGQLYAVSMLVAWQSTAMGMLPPKVLHWITAACLIVFGSVYALVRSGWSARMRDPVLTFPHALASQAICLLAYVLMDTHRGNVMILMGQVIVVAMFRLRPREILTLGTASVGMLTLALVYIRMTAPETLPMTIAWLHLTIGGATILLLSFIGKWVSEIHAHIGRQAGELKETLNTLKHMATTDLLTGLINRRVMNDLLDKELKLSSRQGNPLCVAMLDIDHFKLVNDRFGHQLGDITLSGLAKHVVTQVRVVDKVARWGGEEFLMILPSVGHAEALVALERVRSSTEAMRFTTHDELVTTISVGIAQAIEGDTVETLVERADKALYAAKRAGRNRCQVAHYPGSPQALTMDLRVGAAYLSNDA